MLLAANSVDLVIHTLENQFGRLEYIIDTMINRILNIPLIRNSNLEKLIHYSIELNNMFSIMKSLGSKRHLQNSQLLRELLRKIPEMTKLT